jgi:hypothetical protein
MGEGPMGQCLEPILYPTTDGWRFAPMDRSVKVLGDEQFAKPPLIAEHGLTIRRSGPQ